MISNYYTLSSVTRSLLPLLAGRRISQIYTQHEDELICSIDGCDLSLIFRADRVFPTMYITPGTVRARANTVDLLQSAWGGSFRATWISPSDRIVGLDLASGGTILLQVSGPRTNIFLLNGDAIVVDAFKRRRQSLGLKLSIPSDEIIYDFERFRDACHAHPSERTDRLMKSVFPMLGPVAVRELLARSGILPDRQAGTLLPADHEQIDSAGRNLLVELTWAIPRIYYGAAGVPETFAIINCTHLDSLECREFPDIHQAIRTFIFQSRSATRTSSALATLRADLQRSVEKLLRAGTAMREEAREAERAAEYERNGNAILSMLPVLHRGFSEAQTPDGLIRLDPALSPVENAERYFARARRARTAAHEKEERMKDIDGRIHLARTLLTALKAIVSDDDLASFQRTHAHDLGLFGLTPKAKAQNELPFRIFTVDGAFEVWVGKSSATNDLLTMKYAKPRDLWFHVRGSSGSHVVLRIGSGRGEPGKRAIEQAAAIAAYFSKMKTSSLVPVAVTERRFVRKPRGAEPGSVLLSREKVVFVHPSLPPGKPGNPYP